MAKLSVAALLIVGLLVCRADADTYWVPPQPPRVALQPNVPALAIHAQASRTLAPQHAIIRLVLLGPPVLVTPAPNLNASVLVKSGIEDATLPPLVAEATVGAEELADARKILESSGIPRNIIEAHLFPPSGSANPIGLLSIAVEPSTPSHYADTRRTLEGVLVRYPALRSAGTVVSMNDCGAVQVTSARALQESALAAISFAKAIGFVRGVQQYGHVTFVGDSSIYRSICGSQIAPNPTIDYGTSITPLNGFPDSVDGGALFRIAPGAKSVRLVRFREASYFEHNSYDMPANQLVVPTSEPFIGAHGEFSGVVEPDVLIASIGLSEPSSIPMPEAKMRAIADVIHTSGVAAPDIYEGKRAVFVRLPTVAAAAALKQHFLAALAPQEQRSLFFAVSAGVRDCGAAQHAAASAAFEHALLRANIMASQAHDGLGALIAVNDAGEHSGAICGIARSSSMRDIVDAINAAGFQSAGMQAVFSCRAAIAWRLVGLRAQGLHEKSSPSQTNLAGLDAAFTTYGTTAHGFATVRVAPSRALLSLKVTQSLTPLLKSAMRSLSWESSDFDGVDRVGDLSFANPHDVSTTVNGLRAGGVTVEHLLFHAECAKAESDALRAAVRDALARAHRGRIQALIDQGNTDSLDYVSLCGLTNDVAQKGGYVGERSIDAPPYGTLTQRILIVTR